MSKTSGTNSSIRLKRDHQTSSLEESNLSTKSPSPPIKKQKQQNLMDKETRNRYPNGSSSTFISSNSTKKLIIKNLKSSSKKNRIFKKKFFWFV
jgi:hypothetical protein